MKYRKLVITKEIGEGLKQICLEISERYEVYFKEIGYESYHVHFLVQSIPNYSVSKMIRMLKSITDKELLQRYPEIRIKFWGDKFWTSGFYSNTIGQYSYKEVIKAYVKNQGKEKEYKKAHSDQLTLF